MLLGLTRAFQNGMTRPGSTKDHGAAPPPSKGLGVAQVLPSVGTGPGYYSPL